MTSYQPWYSVNDAKLETYLNFTVKHDFLLLNNDPNHLIGGALHDMHLLHSRTHATAILPVIRFSTQQYFESELFAFPTSMGMMFNIQTTTNSEKY